AVPGSTVGYIALVQVDYSEGGLEIYAVPLAFAAGRDAAHVRNSAASAVLATVESANTKGTTDGLLYDAFEDSNFCSALLDVIGRRRQLKGTVGEIVSTPTRAFRALRGPSTEPLAPSLLRAEQSNNSVAYGDRLILKIFRRVIEGINPDFEIGRFLTERTALTHISQVAGALEYRAPGREASTLAVLQGFVPNEGDAWRYTVDQVKRYFERALTRGPANSAVPVSDHPLGALIAEDPPALVEDMFGGFQETVRLLGQRTAELHLALAADTTDPAFAPEPFT